MAFQKNDFIEINFTGKIKDGVIFDSNIKEDIEKAKALGANDYIVKTNISIQDVIKKIKNYLNS